MVNDANNTGGYGCFVVTLHDKDTGRISTVRTLMQVVSPDENYTLKNKPSSESSSDAAPWALPGHGPSKRRVAETSIGSAASPHRHHNNDADAADHPVISRIHVDYTIHLHLSHQQRCHPQNAPYAWTALLNKLLPFPCLISLITLPL